MGAGQHQTLKNRILLENYFLPGDLERQIERFVEHYNYERYHESLNNVTLADVYLGRVQSILHRRERKDQEENNRTLAIPQSCRLISTNNRSKLSLSQTQIWDIFMTTDSRNHRCSPGTWVSGAQAPTIRITLS